MFQTKQILFSIIVIYGMVSSVISQDPIIPPKLDKCMVELQKAQESCVPNGFDQTMDSIEKWAHDRVKCCKAWTVYNCLVHKGDQVIQEEICKNDKKMIDEILQKWSKSVSEKFVTNGCTPDACNE